MTHPGGARRADDGRGIKRTAAQSPLSSQTDLREAASTKGMYYVLLVQVVLCS